MEFAAAGNPQLIVTGSDGNLWFSETSISRIGQMTTSGVFTDFPTTTPGSLVGITSGPDGNIWFTEPQNAKIGRITTVRHRGRSSTSPPVASPSTS